MRCKPIRTVFRAALAAGLLATCQNAPLSASWKDHLHPSAEACFLHDLQWENFYSAGKAPEHFTKSIVKTDAETRLVADHETEACVAAAKLFELKLQVDAVLDTLRSKSYQLTEAGVKLFNGYSQSRKLILSTIENKSLMLVDWIKIPDMLPVTVVATESTKDFECDWDCGDRHCNNQTSVSASPPLRDLANIFVYTFGDANDSNDSNDSYESYESTDSYVSFDLEPLPSTLALSTENDDTSEDSYEYHAEDSLVSSPETVAGDYEAFIPTAHAWQVGVDPICPEVQVCHPTWHGVGSEPSICCPIERTEEAISTETSVPPAVIAIRPPTLDAEFESLEAASALKVYQYGEEYCLTGLENQCPPDLASSAPDATPIANDEIDDVTSHSFDGFSSPWCDSLNWSPWSSRIGRRFAFGDNAPRMPLSGPAVAAYSKEDLESVSTYSSKLLGEFPNGTHQLDEMDSSDIKFSSKDFLITQDSSTYGLITLPLLDSNGLVMDHAMKSIDEPAAESKSLISRRFAGPIRTVGQFLVDFASQIENQAEQIELARRENNQR